MKPDEIRASLNRRVVWRSPNKEKAREYIFTGGNFSQGRKGVLLSSGASRFESAVDYNLQARRNRGNKKGRQLAAQFLYNSVIYQEISGKRNKKSRKVLTKTI